MNKLKVTVRVIAFITIVAMAACIKDKIDLENISNKIYWNPKLGVPVAYGNLTIADLIESIDSKQIVKEDSNKFLSLVYSNTILSETAKDILKIGNQNYNEVLLESQYNLPAFPTQDTIILTRTTKNPFLFNNNEIIDSVNLKTGTMVFNVTSSYKYSGKLTIIIPKLIKNHKPFEIVVDINKADGSFSSTENFDLSGYKLQLEHPNVSDNLISYNYSAKLVNNGSGVSVGDKITIDIDFNNITFSSLYGYIGYRQLLNTASQFSIPLFQNISQPNLKFTNPKIVLRTTNSFGLPASMELYNVNAVNGNDNKTVQLSFVPGKNPFTISYPPSIGNSINDTVIFNNSTTNLNSLLAIGPNNIFYGIRSFSNPGGRVFNYVTDSSKISVDMDIELPLDMSASQIEFKDTMELDLSDIGDNSEKVKSLLLHTSFENGMPADLSLRIYLLDKNYNHIDTIFNAGDQNIIKSGTVDSQGRITGKTQKDIDVLFNHTQIERLKNVKYALVKAGVITANGGNTFVKFYSNYTINVHFGIQTELEIKEN